MRRIVLSVGEKKNKVRKVYLWRVSFVARCENSNKRKERSIDIEGLAQFVVDVENLTVGNVHELVEQSNGVLKRLRIADLAQKGEQSLRILRSLPLLLKSVSSEKRKAHTKERKTRRVVPVRHARERDEKANKKRKNKKKITNVGDHINLHIRGLLVKLLKQLQLLRGDEADLCVLPPVQSACQHTLTRERLRKCLILFE